MGGVRIYLDTCVIVYLVEGDAELREAIRQRILADSSIERLCVSELGRMECRVRPMRDRDGVRLRALDDFFALESVEVLELGREGYELATRLQAELHLKTPDARHAATAIHHGCGQLWTNDAKLSRLGPRIEVVRVP